MTGNSDLRQDRSGRLWTGFALLVWVMCSAVAHGAVWYVDGDAPVGGADGMSWATAFPTIQAAVDATAPGASEGDPAEVWVAEGVYTGAGDDAVVTMEDHVHLYGGFAGTESTREERDWTAHETVINGEDARRGVSARNVNVVVDGLVVTQGAAGTASGGGLHQDRGALVLRNMTFLENSGDSGGGLSAVLVDLDASGCRFERNQAGRGGGLFLNQVTAALTDCAFTANRADSGGGIQSLRSDLTATGCTMDGNRAEGTIGFGGGISTQGGALAFTACQFTNNEAYRGGACDFSSGETATFVDCRIAGNHALGTGGALCVHEGSTAMDRCEVTENTAARGSAANSFASGYALRLTNTVVARNSGENAAIYLPYGTLEALNSVVAYNVSGGDSPVDGVQRVDLVNAIVWGNVPALGFSTDVAYDIHHSCLETFFPNNNNVFTDPRFWSPATGDFRLHPDSPCLDAGAAPGESPSIDIEGNPRPVGAGVDMGVHEMNEVDSDTDGLYDTFETVYAGTSPNNPDSDGEGGTDSEDWFQSRVWYVDAAAARGESDGLSWSSAAPTIQEVVDRAVAQGGGEVWVKEGTYRATSAQVVWLFPGIHLYGGFAGEERARDERDPVAHPVVIDGEDTRRGVIVAGACRLDGVTVQFGYGTIGGNIVAQGEDWVVENCVIRDGRGEYGAGGLEIGAGSGQVLGCEILENTAASYAALHATYATLRIADTRIAGNEGYNLGVAGYFGFGDVVLERCRIEGNRGEAGAILFLQDADVRFDNVVVHGNEIRQNAGILAAFQSSLKMTHCSVVDNRCGLDSAVIRNGSRSDIDITNSILWNASRETSGRINSIAYSCVRGGFNGEGNITQAPKFWNVVTGDLRQHPRSPCLNRTDAPVVLETDIDGNPRPLDGGVDLGAIETDQTDSDGDGLLDGFETAWSKTDPGNPNSDNYGAWDGYTWFKRRPWLVDAASTSETPDGVRWSAAFRTIQEAVDAAALHGGGDVWIAAGTYTGEGESVVYLRDGVSLLGGFAGTEWHESLRNPDAHPAILDGEEDRRGVRMLGRTRLDGLVITRGFALEGGGVYGESAQVTIQDCDVVDNETIWCGGGICLRGPTASVANSYIADNESAVDAGGFWLGASYGRVENCVFTGNTAARNGAALVNAYTGAVFTHCTITGNPADADTGAVYSYTSGFEVMANSILYDNGVNIVNNTDRLLPVQDALVQGGYDGVRILDAQPRFVNDVGRDFRLAANSPALDIGEPGLGVIRDIAGVKRPQGAGYDLGAYERPVEDLRSKDEAAKPVESEAPEESAGATAIRHLDEDTIVRQGASPDDHLDLHTQRLVTPDTIHDADNNGDRVLTMEELLRVVQLYNADAIACDATTEDGYAPGAGTTSCPPHHLDYEPQNWRIDLNELLRAIAFYNAGGPYPCPTADTEDGFCAATE